MNRRRPWHHRLIRRLARHAPHEGILPRSPLSHFFVFNLLAALISLLFGAAVVALVFAAAAIGCVSCQRRRHAA